MHGFFYVTVWLVDDVMKSAAEEEVVGGAVT